MNGTYSTHCHLLPYLEQSVLYHQINFKLMCGDPGWLEQFHSTVASQVVNVFLCPSDPSHRSMPFATNSYRGCKGVGESHLVGQFFERHYDGLFDSSDFGIGKTLPLSQVRDGLANTLAFSEKSVGSGPMGRFHPRRDWVETWDMAADLSSDFWMTRCSSLGTIEERFLKLEGGTSWMLPAVFYTFFFTSAPPNFRAPDCGRSDLGGVFAARSLHPGGVNAAMADGSTRWVRSSIDRQLWRHLGTRSGDEPISAF